VVIDISPSGTVSYLEQAYENEAYSIRESLMVWEGVRLDVYIRSAAPEAWEAQRPVLDSYGHGHIPAPRNIQQFLFSDVQCKVHLGHAHKTVMSHSF
jgi:hypothetical protein